MGVAQEALQLARGGAQTGEFVFRAFDVPKCAAQGKDECLELALDSASKSASEPSGEKPFEVASPICIECVSVHVL